MAIKQAMTISLEEPICSISLCHKENSDKHIPFTFDFHSQTASFTTHTNSNWIFLGSRVKGGERVGSNRQNIVFFVEIVGF